MGQWLSPDPAFDGLNLYAYVHNNPINMVDPTGLSAEYGRDNPIPVAGTGLNGGQQFFQADNPSEAGYQDAATFDRNSANSPVYEANNNGLSPQAAMALGSMGADGRSSTAGMENGGLGPLDSALQGGMVGAAVANMESGSAIRTDGSGSSMGIPGGQCSSCSGGRGYQAAYVGLTLGAVVGGAAMQGYSALRATRSELQIVTSWADVGTTPDLNPGRWVQLGLPTPANYWLTGLPGPKWMSPYWNFRFQGSKAAMWNSITDAVPRSSLAWPAGGFKGIFGQRRIK